jgi:hypothetical protein
MVDSEHVAGARRAMRDAITTIEKGYADALTAFAMVDTTEDRQAAFELANDLAKRLERLDDAAARLRKRCIHRIWKAEEMSLATLANRVGVTKSRADQFVRDFKAEQTGGKEGQP